MTDLAELYQDIILDHSKQPRNFGELSEANRHADGYNPLCGDHIEVWIRIDDDHVGKVHFSGSACAICTASASMMSQALQGKSHEESGVLFEQMRQMLAGTGDGDIDQSGLGKLAALGGVRRYPMRVKCATLPWHTFKAALDENTGQPVTTEQ
ncbi:MAG: SUF system NifU family Fe-S cluster assembly protein [Phycisphaeraceae bacterium]|nr:SUF system NifU family Fe-S cluster assembly protein [Phycisphaeraceae bacterium]|tara:strand:- start:425 stop:883 length:459 start_codon:yes stop_codon:yes gene_type:complete